MVLDLQVEGLLNRCDGNQLEINQHLLREQ